MARACRSHGLSRGAGSGGRGPARLRRSRPGGIVFGGAGFLPLSRRRGRKDASVRRPQVRDDPGSGLRTAGRSARSAPYVRSARTAGRSPSERREGPRKSGPADVLPAQAADRNPVPNAHRSEDAICPYAPVHRTDNPPAPRTEAALRRETAASALWAEDTRIPPLQQRLTAYPPTKRNSCVGLRCERPCGAEQNTAADSPPFRRAFVPQSARTAAEQRPGAHTRPPLKTEAPGTPPDAAHKKIGPFLEEALPQLPSDREPKGRKPPPEHRPTDPCTPLCTQKKVRPFDLTLKRRLPTLPRENRSTIGVSELNFSVRNGKRWNLTAITT